MCQIAVPNVPSSRASSKSRVRLWTVLRSSEEAWYIASAARWMFDPGSSQDDSTNCNEYHTHQPRGTFSTSVDVAYKMWLMYCSMKLTEKGGLKLTTCVIAGFEALEYFIKPFKQEHPELLQWSIVAYTLSHMSGIMVIGSHHGSTIQLITQSMYWQYSHV